MKKDESLLPVLMNQVKDKIAEIRNVDVIADADVAALYGVDTRLFSYWDCIRPLCIQ